jgi:hypothetical protein
MEEIINYVMKATAKTEVMTAQSTKWWGNMLNYWDIRVLRGKRCIFSPKLCLWSALSLIFIGYQRLLPWGKSSWGMMLTYTYREVKTL